jgi:3-keto-5-aminohexanoate cleavage enzyme
VNDGAVVIEVGLNEDVTRDRHPQVPVQPDEIAEDALRCQEAGAAVVHWHARDTSGAPVYADADVYAAALRIVRARSDLLMYPTYPAAPSDSPDVRFGHVWRLRETCGLELAPLDVGSVNLAPWDPLAGRFAGDPARFDSRTIFQNSLGLIVATLERVRALGMAPAVTSFDLGFTRTVVHLVRAGLLAQPVYLKLFLYGDLVAGPFPSEVAIDAHLAQIPDDVDVEWCVVPTHLSDPAIVERLCRHALAHGGGVRVGLGDNPDAYPHLDNAALVALAATWAADAGRRVASSADVRTRLGLAPSA